MKHACAKFGANAKMTCSLSNVYISSDQRRDTPSGMARVNEDHTDLLATHTFIHEQNEPSCIHFVSIYQMTSPERGNERLDQLTAYYSFIDLERMKGSVGLVGRPYSGWFTHISGQWSPISYRSSVGQGKFAGQRPAFYHCAVQPGDRLLRYRVGKADRRTNPKRLWKP